MTDYNPMKKTRITQDVETTDSGIHVVKNKVEVQEPFFVKEVSKEEYEVRRGDGEIIRTYIKEEGCEDPKACAESYAQKLSRRWQSR